MEVATLAGALGLALPSSAAVAQDPVAAPPAGGAASPVDRQFAGRASASDTFGIRSSQIAVKSRDPAVRDVARWMVHSHTAAEPKLRGALDGAAFDKACVEARVGRARHGGAADAGPCRAGQLRAPAASRGRDAARGAGPPRPFPGPAGPDVRREPVHGPGQLLTSAPPRRTPLHSGTNRSCIRFARGWEAAGPPRGPGRM